MGHLVGQGGAEALISGRTAWLLSQRFGLEKIRLDVRGRDPVFDADLKVIHDAGAAYRRRQGLEPEQVGTSSDAEPELPSRSKSVMSSRQAADRLGCTTRWVLLLVERNVLRGDQLPNRQWRIDPQSVIEHLESSR